MIGVNFLLSVLVLVWVADIGAYFAGRAFGQSRRKLAPRDQPGQDLGRRRGAAWLGVLVLAVAWIVGDRALGAACRACTRGSPRWAGRLVLVAACSSPR